MTMDPATTIGIGAVATVALHWMGKTAYEVVKKKSANGAVKAALNAGDQDPAFWQMEFRAAIDEKLNQRIIPILETQTKTLDRMAELLTEIKRA